jgi:serine/threonine protein kinase
MSSSPPRSVTFTTPTGGAPPQAGQTVCYELLARIGGGSFGRVFLARSIREGCAGPKGRIIRVPVAGTDLETASSSSASDTCSLASVTPPASPRAAGGELPLPLAAGAGAAGFAMATSPEGSLSSGGSSGSGDSSSGSSSGGRQPHHRLRAVQAAAQAGEDADGLVAIKLLRRSAITKHTLAEISNQLQQLHPHITTMHQVLLTRHHIAMVLEYANGGSPERRCCLCLQSAGPGWRITCMRMHAHAQPHPTRPWAAFVGGAWMCAGF